ncbi:MAG TPA: peptidylprolyl isomerase [Thermoanaerobaculia bacterium]|nr:peptidylprolyl isomerase [Thermoanaerobaculia bacterium]
MNRFTLAAAAFVFALPAVAQQPAAAPAPAESADKIVAVVNGETITQTKLDQLWEHAGAQMRTQYQKTGGKKAFLDNYVKKRLILQEAIKSGFDKRPEVQAEAEAARESAIFDRYVRDVVAGNLISDADVKKFYESNMEQFKTPERVKVRHIVVAPRNNGPAPKTDVEAKQQIQTIAAELFPYRIMQPGDENAKKIFLARFADAARRYSEDGSAEAGGDLGWVTRDQLDADFAEAAFNIKPGMMSGIVHSQFGYHIIFVEDREPSGYENFEDVKSGIREFLTAQKAGDVMANVSRLTSELRAHSKVQMFPENIK